jgi:hypothetical protein
MNHYSSVTAVYQKGDCEDTASVSGSFEIKTSPVNVYQRPDNRSHCDWQTFQRPTELQTATIVMHPPAVGVQPGAEPQWPPARPKQLHKENLDRNCMTHYLTKQITYSSAFYSKMKGNSLWSLKKGCFATASAYSEPRSWIQCAEERKTNTSLKRDLKEWRQTARCTVGYIAVKHVLERDPLCSDDLRSYEVSSMQWKPHITSFYIKNFELQTAHVPS